MTLIPVHPSITEMPDEDRERLYLDDYARWVGPTAPSVQYVDGCRVWADDQARRLADLILDGDPDYEWMLRHRRESYARARDELRRVEAVERHCFTPGAEGFAGWIVRSSASTRTH